MLTSTPPFVRLVVFTHDSFVYMRFLANAQDLKPALEKYHRQGLTSNKRISELLKADYNIEIKLVLFIDPSHIPIDYI